MKYASHHVLEDLEAAAKAAQAAETKFRAEMAREIARVERERVFAFRRVRFAKLLADAIASAEQPEAVTAAQRRAVANEFGWDSSGDRHRAVLDRVEVLGAAFKPETERASDERSTPDFASALKEFEAWYQGHAGEPFYSLFDQYVPEAPLVDF